MQYIFYIPLRQVKLYPHTLKIQLLLLSLPLNPHFYLQLSRFIIENHLEREVGKNIFSARGTKGVRNWKNFLG